MKLLVATRSPGKAREIRSLLEGLPFEVLLPADRLLDRLPSEDELESGTSYAENAVLKARHFAERGGLPTVADDSGLEVDALGGAPGVHSARWAGAGATDAGQDARNNAKLVAALTGVPERRRTARYRCVVAYLGQVDATPEIVEATCEGQIVLEPRGTGGFGYDPYFFSPELGLTFGEASLPAKHRVSHRGRAFRALAEMLLRKGM
ncbi:MAG TPA: RdgB/HAM1 family non-canonical purine NTP pyrophosphatase [Gemmatimonadales bacterium]|jgi:XTP/dITP diphosphohydrolase|nr:RdgB/HAM1 family non-canonical purine NTP pyrophosphatase [Gemmatimonadales bacterium]